MRRSQSAPHMHVLVCICSNVRQYHNMWPGPLNCYATLSTAVAYVHMGLILSTPKGLHGTRQKGRTTGSLTSALPRLWLTPVGQVIAASVSGGAESRFIRGWERGDITVMPRVQCARGGLHAR